MFTVRETENETKVSPDSRGVIDELHHISRIPLSPDVASLQEEGLYPASAVNHGKGLPQTIQYECRVKKRFHDRGGKHYRGKRREGRGGGNCLGRKLFWAAVWSWNTRAGLKLETKPADS